MVVELALAVRGHEGDVLGGADGEVEAVAADVARAAGRQVRAGKRLPIWSSASSTLVAVTQYVARRRRRSRVSCAGEAHGDPGAVVDGRVGGGQHDVAVGELDALAARTSPTSPPKVWTSSPCRRSTASRSSHRREGDGAADQRRGRPRGSTAMIRLFVRTALPGGVPVRLPGVDIRPAGGKPSTITTMVTEGPNRARDGRHLVVPVGCTRRETGAIPDRRPEGYQEPPNAASVLASIAAHSLGEVAAEHLGHRAHGERHEVRRVRPAAVAASA